MTTTVTTAAEALTDDVLIKSLPCEVLEQILENENLQINDVTSFAMTCKHLYWAVTTNNKLWKIKFFQRWPILQEAFEYEGTAGGIENPDWHEETKEKFLCRHRLMDKLSEMPTKHRGKEHLSDSDLKDYDPLFLPDCGARPMSYHYLTDELIMLLRENSIDCNPTYKHYAPKVVRYLRQSYLTRQWQKYLSLPPERLTAELGAHIVAQWNQPEEHVSLQLISNKLDEIAQQTRDLVAEKYPNIPINNVPLATLARWKVENIYDNQWNNEDAKAIALSLFEMFFKRLGFHVNSDMFHAPENLFIDQVLVNRRGIPITLTIVFESIARRLGLHCETIAFPTDVWIRWKQRYIPNVNEDKDCEIYYISVFHGGKFTLAGNSYSRFENQKTSIIEVVQRIAKDLTESVVRITQWKGKTERVRSARELLLMLKPRDINEIRHLSQLYQGNEMDVSRLIGILSDMIDAGNEDTETRNLAKLIKSNLQQYEKKMKGTMKRT